ncbi:MAG: transglycosylase SLT domain-containing protein [Sphingomonadales bacterium]
MIDPRIDCPRWPRPRPASRVPAFIASGLIAVAIFAAVALSNANAAPVLNSKEVLNSKDLSLYQAAFKAVKQRDWSKAFATSAQASDPAPARVIEWLYLQEPDSGASFERIGAFLDANPDWPHRVRLARRAELALDDDAPVETIIDWFSRHPPVSGEGRLKLGQALIATGRSEEGDRWLREAWITGSFSAQRERDIRRRLGARLTPDLHARRLDHMLWNGNSGAARRALPLAPADIAALGKARLALARRTWNVDQAIADVPAHLVDHPGLVYERIRWRRKKGLHERAQELLATAPRTPAELVRPDKWWFERRIQVRHALTEGRIADAYELASRHGLAREADWQAQGNPIAGQPRAVRARIAEAEWLSGWIALTRLNEPDTAFRHFERAYAVVRLPVSVARATFWAGRAAQAQGDKPRATEWFEKAARHGSSFYGQLAALEVGPPPALADAAVPTPTVDEIAAFARRELVHVCRTLAEIGEHRRLRPFVRSLLVKVGEPRDRNLLAQHLRDTGRPDLALMVARASASEGIAMADHNYPTRALAPTLSATGPLLHGVIRQESGFYPEAKSPAGALGLMQLMPYTAFQTARGMKLAYNKNRLLSDPAYNTQIGTGYLTGLLERYRGSYILALAAYNAGPNAVNRWLRTFGDPRNGVTDPVDWIEMIPYRETRDYVQRVLEATQIYRRRLNSVSEPGFGINHDLHRAVQPSRPTLLPRPRPRHHANDRNATH